MILGVPRPLDCHLIKKSLLGAQKSTFGDSKVDSFDVCCCWVFFLPQTLERLSYFFWLKVTNAKGRAKAKAVVPALGIGSAF